MGYFDVYFGVLHINVKVKASITDKIREFSFVWEEALVGDSFSCEEKQILRRMQNLWI